MTMGNHTHKTRPQNCPKCMKVHRYDTGEWIMHSKSKFGNKFNYSKTIYRNARTKLIITCDIHGELFVDPTNHMISPTGCERCSSQQTGLSQRRTQDSLITQFLSQHGSRYDYSKVDYQGDSKNILIICKVHGEFSQRAIAHANGRNCNDCMNEENGIKARLNTEEFILRSNEVHNGKYDYSKVNYLTSDDDVTIICPDHGEFRQRASNHMNKEYGCWKCGQMKSGLNRRVNDDEWLLRFNKVHGDKYNYSNFKSNGAELKSKIICKEHGLFMQSPITHSHGVGCPDCGRDKAALQRRISQTEFLDRFEEVHQGEYDYSLVEYTTSKHNVTIVCKIHGSFEQLPYVHASGGGCSVCSRLSSGIKRRLSLREILGRFREAHGESFDYSKFIYKGERTKSTIICREHGSFEQSPVNHWTSIYGCRRCAGKDQNTDNMIDLFRATHGDRYDYSQFIYRGNKTYSTIICHEHGGFEQVPHAHRSGQGCPDCSIFGFRYDKQGYYYCLSISGHGGHWWYKGGISSDPQRRASQVQSSLRENNLLLDVDVVDSILFDKGIDARNLEKILLNTEDIRVISIDKFDGSNELFSHNPIEFARSMMWI